jgi:hypothetical protein
LLSYKPPYHLFYPHTVIYEMFRAVCPRYLSTSSPLCMAGAVLRTQGSKRYRFPNDVEVPEVKIGCEPRIGHALIMKDRWPKRLLCPTKMQTCAVENIAVTTVRRVSMTTARNSLFDHLGQMQTDTHAECAAQSGACFGACCVRQCLLAARDALTWML